MVEKKIDTVLFFGSFNPIHNGHTSVAAYVFENGLCDELWFVVSPKNPLKPAGMLVPERDRFAMTQIAVNEQLAGFKAVVSDIEFHLPKPSYTIDTLEALGVRFPERSFSILAGADIFSNIDQWKESERLLSDYRFLIYPREGYILDHKRNNIVYLNDAPKWYYSSTDVREALEHGDKKATQMISPGVLVYVKARKLWVTDTELDDTDNEIEIASLTNSISAAPLLPELYLARGAVYYSGGRYDKALNDFLKVRELDPENIEAGEYISLIQRIFEYRYMDYYNP